MGQFKILTACPECGSRDNLAVYQDEESDEYNASCFGTTCEAYYKHSVLLEMGVLNEDGTLPEGFTRQSGGKSVSQEQLDSYKDKYSSQGWKNRGISKESAEKYGVLCEGSPSEHNRWFPSYRKGSLVGYKLKPNKKVDGKYDYRVVGSCSTNDELFGQHLFSSGGKYLVITTGQEDAIAMYEVLASDKYETPCVSVNNGDKSVKKQFQANYEFISSFDKVVLFFDDDEPGRQALDEACRILKPGQAHIAKMVDHKDACEYKKRGLDAKLKDIFFKAERFSPSGIVGSSDTWDALTKRAEVVKVSLPDFASDLSSMLRGGPALGEITTIAAACVDNQTEFMTENGWKTIDEFRQGDKVLTFDPENRQSDFKEPLNYIKEPCNKFYHFKTRYGIDQVVSPNHRMPYLNHNNEIIVKNAEEILQNHNKNVKGFRGKFIQTFAVTGGEGIELSEGEIRLSVAVKADGRVVKEGKDNYTQMRFRKKRKYDRLLEMCKKFNLKYSDRGWKESERTYEVIVWPKCANKRYDDWWNATPEQLAIIADECLYWDGTQIHANVYFSGHKEDADFIQYAFASVGVRSTVQRGTNVWEVLCAKNPSMGISSGASGKVKIKEYKEHDGYQYCFETDTGMWVARRNGKVFVTGNSSIGKTSLVNALTYHWVMNTPYKWGIISLESDIGELTENMMSLHLGVKIANMYEDEQREFYSRPDIRHAHDTLTKTEDGHDRYIILDHNGSVADDELRAKMEYLVKGCGCQGIILDPLTLAMSGEGNEGMDEFMSWLLRFVKREGVCHINVAHVRKNSTGGTANSRGAEISEEDIKGSSSIFQVSMNNILLTRDKVHEDPIVRNTTKVILSKNRRCGNTGPAGYWYYDNKTSLYKAIDLTDGSFEDDAYSEDLKEMEQLNAFNNTVPEEFTEDWNFNKPED